MENIMWDILISAFASDYMKDWEGERRAFTAFCIRLIIDFFNAFWLLEDHIKEIFEESFKKVKI